MRKLKGFNSAPLATQVWAIPACVSVIRAELWGAAGGGPSRTTGTPSPANPNQFTDSLGLATWRHTAWQFQDPNVNGSNPAGYISGAIFTARDADDVPLPGASLHVRVGQNGANGTNRTTTGVANGGNGGWPDGGNGGDGYRNNDNGQGGSGGGGGTSIHFDTPSVDNTLLCAGGSGGNGGWARLGDEHIVDLPSVPSPPYMLADLLSAPASYGLPLCYFDPSVGRGGIGGVTGGTGGQVLNPGTGTLYENTPATGATETDPGLGGDSPNANVNYNGNPGTFNGGDGGTYDTAPPAGRDVHGGGGGGGGYRGGGGGAALSATNANLVSSVAATLGGGGGGGSNYAATDEQLKYDDWLPPMDVVSVSGAVPPGVNPAGIDIFPNGLGGYVRLTYQVHPSTPSNFVLTGGNTHGERDSIELSFKFQHTVAGATMKAWELWVSEDAGMTFTRYARYDLANPTAIGATTTKTLPFNTFRPVGQYVLAINTIDREDDDNIDSRFAEGYGGMATLTLNVMAAPTTPVVTVTSIVPAGADRDVAFSWTAPSGTPVGSVISMGFVGNPVAVDSDTIVGAATTDTLTWPAASGSTDEGRAQVSYAYDTNHGYSDPGEVRFEINFTPPTATASVALNKDSAMGVNTLTLIRTGGTDINKFSVYRSEDGGTTWTRIVRLADMASGTGTFVDHTVQTDKSYLYKVRVYGTGYGTGAGSDGWREITDGTVTGQ